MIPTHCINKFFFCRVAVQPVHDQNYTWVEGPKYRAGTDYDSKNVKWACLYHYYHYLIGNDMPTSGESTTHVCNDIIAMCLISYICILYSFLQKIYYIVLPSVLFVLMVVMIVGSMMVFSKVKYGTFCCCSSWVSVILFLWSHGRCHTFNDYLRMVLLRKPSRGIGSC